MPALPLRSPARLAFAAALVFTIAASLVSRRAEARSDTRELAVAAPVRRAPIVTTVDADAELRFLNRVNRQRADRGLAPLVRDESLRDLARYHSADMALEGFVGLVSPQAGPILDRAAAAGGVSRLDVTAQVTVGGEAAGVGAQLLDPALGRVGVGIVTSGGRAFLTQLAVAAPAPAVYTAVDARLASLPLFLGRLEIAVARALSARAAVAFRW